jgi:hypothetical protein
VRTDELGKRLVNRAFDRRRAERRLAELGIPLGRHVRDAVRSGDRRARGRGPARSRVVRRRPASAARADGPREEHLVATLPADARTPDGWTRTGVSLEELVLAYLREPPIYIGRGWTG